MSKASITTLLNLLVLRCKNIETTKLFYEKLDFSFVVEQHGNGSVHYSTKMNGVVLELYPSSEQFPVDTCRLGFSFSDSSRLESLASTLGCKTRDRDEYSYLVVQDPDGRKVEIT